MLEFKAILELLKKEDWDGILAEIPEFRRLEGLWQGTKYHYTDAWTHTKHVVKAVKLIRSKLEGKKVKVDFSPSAESGFFKLVSLKRLFDPDVEKWLLSTLSSEMFSGVSMWDVVMVAALFHDIGKPDTAEDVGDGIRVHFIGHPEVGAQILKNKLGGLAFEEPWYTVIELVEKHFMLLSGFNYNFPDKRYIPDVRKDMNFRAMLMLLSLADIISSKSSYRFDEYTEYLGTVAWYWLYFEKLLELQNCFLSTTYHPDKYFYLKEIIEYTEDIPDSSYNKVLDKISIQIGNRRLNLSKALAYMAEFALRNPIHVILKEAVRFTYRLILLLPSSRKILENKGRRNRRVDLGLKTVRLINGELRDVTCKECVTLATSIMCEMGKFESAVDYALILDDVALIARVARYCGSPELRNKIRRKSSFYWGWVQGFKFHSDISQWLNLHCDSIPFCSWDNIFERLVTHVLTSPPFTSGKAIGELQRLYLKFWECIGLKNLLSEYSQWILSHEDLFKRTEENREFYAMLVASTTKIKEESILNWIVEDEHLLAAALLSNPHALFYVKDTTLMRALLDYDIGSKVRKVIKCFIGSSNGCEAFKCLLKIVGDGDMNFNEIEEVYEVIDKLSLRFSRNKEKGLASLPALLRFSATQCLNESVKRRESWQPKNMLKRIAKLLIKPL